MISTTSSSPSNIGESTNKRHRITIAHGDGIGPEIMKATLKILESAGAALDYDEITVGEQVFLQGHSAGISPESWDVLRKNPILLKGPITTPQGGGYKSLNVTIRKSMGLYANVRPCRAYTPYVESHFPEMDLVVIRENEEDLYAGIEHQQTPEVVQCLKLVSSTGCERIIRYAFEYARSHNRKKVTCMSKDNIMKLTDGMFHRIFDEVKAEYPDIDAEHHIIDIGSALIATNPERFDVIVTTNLYGDIVSDITAQIAGSVGLGGSSNVGDNLAMFEAIHGSAPDIAGKDMANPSGLIHAACMMLSHLGEGKMAGRILNALLSTLEDGIHTGDLWSESFTKKKVGTQEFADAVIERLDRTPAVIKPVSFSDDLKPIRVVLKPKARASKELTGVDLFIDWNEDNRDADVLGKGLEAAAQDMKLKMITNRGVKVYPNGFPETHHTDHWRCRFIAKDASTIQYEQIMNLMQQVSNNGYDIIKTENLYMIDGKRAYSLGQGE
ncbi:MAG: NADP-dependent isocitrate dehydrogenase [Bacteroidia bacterium]